MNCFEDGGMRGLQEVSEIEKAEIPRFKKRRQSSISKSVAKSKHRHEYEECLFVDKYGEHHKGNYCFICGKIGHVDIIETVRERGGWRRKLTENEICEKYKHLEQTEVEDFFQKFIVLRSGGDD